MKTTHEREERLNGYQIIRSIDYWNKVGRAQLGGKKEPYYKSEDEYYDPIYYFTESDSEKEVKVDPKNLDRNYMNFINWKRCM